MLTSSAIRRIDRLAQDASTSGRLDLYDSLSPFWRNSIGSLGSGNHFIEVVLDERNRVWAFLHSGSRGIGLRIANHHIKIAKKLMKQYHINLPDPELAYLVLGTDEFKDYLLDVSWAQKLAVFNSRRDDGPGSERYKTQGRRRHDSGRGEVSSQLRSVGESLRQECCGLPQRGYRGEARPARPYFQVRWEHARTL